MRRIIEAAKAEVSKDKPAAGGRDDEFQIIGDHLDILRTSRTRLTVQLQGQTRQLKEYFIRKLLLGQLKPSEINEKLDQLQYVSSGEWNCVLTVQIDTLKGTRLVAH
ncbi:hypothetical protein [Paenibacillus riograndensis]|uniref:hypothetical protein n=1 Tax=Paenibacillus riograndensis TaxID=483937 RepID=UPI0005929413|nr:hypothetical protein [Paenibacillus riograndensis]